MLRASARSSCPIGRASLARLPVDQVLGEQVEEHAVVVDAVHTALVTPHHTNLLEADLFVGGDGVNVVGGRIDGDAVMPAFVEEEVRNEPNRLRSEALALMRRREEQVDAGVSVVAMKLLPSRDPADRFLVHFDHECGDAFGSVGIISGEKFVAVEVVIGLAPVASHLRLAEDLQQAREIGFDNRAKNEAGSSKDDGHA